MPNETVKCISTLSDSPQRSPLFSNEVCQMVLDPKLSFQSESQEKRASKIIELKNLVLDLNIFGVRVNGRSLGLSAFSFKLLRYFLDNANRLIPRQEFLEEVCENTELDDRVIDAHIVSLRKKLKQFRGEIKTIYRMGYILKVDGKTR